MARLETGHNPSLNYLTNLFKKQVRRRVHLKTGVTEQAK